MLHGKSYENFPVTLENVQFLRATSLMKNKDVMLSISIHKGICKKIYLTFKSELKINIYSRKVRASLK